LIQKPARAAAVKDGRHADLFACSAASRPRLDGREHDGTPGAAPERKITIKPAAHQLECSQAHQNT
jgi:hypothetical protein